MVLKRVGVTGVSGMVGRHLLAHLSQRGIEVIGTSRKCSSNLSGKNSWKLWDLTQWHSSKEFDKIFGKVDALFHIGAIVPTPHLKICDQDLLMANVNACRSLGSWALERDIPIVYLSGAIVYDSPKHSRGDIDETVQRTTKPAGGLYGFTKVLAEQVFENMVPLGLKLTVLRASSVYGWGLNKEKMLPKMLSQACAGETIILKEPVNDQIDLVHAGDIARSLVDVIEAEQRGFFNIGGEKHTIISMANTCVELAKKGQVIIEPNSTSQLNSCRFPISHSKATQYFGYHPRINLYEGLERMLMRKT